MEDVKTLKHAKHYMSAMADGINPLTGEFASESDVISQERIQKCCAYIADLLGRIIENEGRIENRKLKLSLSQQQIDSVKISSVPIGINEIAKRINDVKEKNMRGITGAKIAAWLVDNGYLSVQTTTSEETKEVVHTKKVLNENSYELGITSERVVKQSTGEVYDKLLYSDKAQRFILDNIYKIIDK